MSENSFVLLALRRKLKFFKLNINVMKTTFTLLATFIISFCVLQVSAQWCIPVVQPYGPTTPGITHFTLNDINRTSEQIENPDDGYVLTGMSTTLHRGQTYSISITHTVDAYICPDMNLRVWIDYNINGTLDDAGETVITIDHHSAGTYTATFTVPATALVGTTRLRATAKMSNLGGHTPPTPCNFPFDPLGYHGEVEDYTVNIAAETGIDVVAPTTPALSVFPNPANESATLNYSLTENQRVKIELFNGLGQIEKVFAFEDQIAGDHQYNLELKNVEAGFYFVRLSEGVHTYSLPLIVEPK